MGEDVTDYNEEGLADGTAGTWLAGREGPPEMIMPADPQVGDVHRAENIPAIAFEEVEIKEIDKTVPGPVGPVAGAMVARELHDDGTYSDKVFAPGYGEFFTAHGGEVEAMALALPTDASSEPVPAELEALSKDATAALDSVEAGNWAAAEASAKRIADSWASLQKAEQPPRLAKEMDRATKALTTSAAAHDEADAANAAIDVGQSALDLRAALPAAGRDRPGSIRPVDAPDPRSCGRRRHRRRQRRRDDAGVDPRPDRSHARAR